MIFRVGDYVEPVRNSNRVRKGEVYRVTRVSPIRNWLKLEGFNGMFNPILFKLYKDNDEMNKFKIGDKVRKIKDGTPPFPVGYEGEVTGFPSTFKGRIYVDNNCHSNVESWELVEDKDKYPNGKHPHHDIIIEYAKGAEIEVTCVGAIDEWRMVPLPVFHPDHKYRVKPQQDPAVQAAKKKIEQAEQMLREANDELEKLR